MNNTESKRSLLEASGLKMRKWDETYADERAYWKGMVGKAAKYAMVGLYQLYNANAPISGTKVYQEVEAACLRRCEEMFEQDRHNDILILPIRYTANPTQWHEQDECWSGRGPKVNAYTIVSKLSEICFESDTEAVVRHTLDSEIHRSLAEYITWDD